MSQGTAARADAAALRAIAALAAVLVVGALRIDLPERSGHAFWSDGATYYAMAWSLAEDRDVEYRVHDVLRVRREFPTGPQGVFLKRASGGLIPDPEGGFPWLRRLGPGERRIYYAKSLVYPLVAAPLVALVGTRGLLLANALAMSAAVWIGYGIARRRAPPAEALAWTLVLFFLTATPLYLVWPQPEILDLALITAGLGAWISGRPVLSALAFGIATYAKPTNLLLALPLGVEPLVRRPAGPWWRGIAESCRRGAALLAVVAAGYGLNAVVTGELNYQGGERKTFYGTFPYETPGVTFGNSGTWMTTNSAGPPVEGEADSRPSRGAEAPLSAEEVRGAFAANLGYFWIGRYGGALAYFAPVVVAAALFLLRGPRDLAGGLALAALVLSWLAFIALIPDNWYGGGGTLGNRYFVNLVPLGLLLVPRARVRPALLLGGLAGAVFVAPMLLHPFVHSRDPHLHAEWAAYRLLPLERTMLNDLAFCDQPGRCGLSVGDTVGDPHRNWPPDPQAYFLYFPDEEAVASLETLEDRTGFRLRPGARAEVVLRSLAPVRAIEVTARAGPGGDIVEIRGGGGALRLPVAADSWARGTLATPKSGLLYHGTFVEVLELRSRATPGLRDDEASFVSFELRIDAPRPRERGAASRRAPSAPPRRVAGRRRV